MDSKAGCCFNAHSSAGARVDRMVGTTRARVPSHRMGDGRVSRCRHCPGHSRCSLDISSAGFSSASGGRDHRSWPLHEGTPAATPGYRRSNHRRGELGRWASDYTFAVSRATAVAHSLLRKPGAGARSRDHPRRNGAPNEFSRFSVYVRGRRPRAQRANRFLSAARNRKCLFPWVRSIAGLGSKSGRGSRGPRYTKTIDRRRGCAKQDLWTHGGREASPLYRPSGGHAGPSHPAIRLRLAL